MPSDAHGASEMKTFEVTWREHCKESKPLADVHIIQLLTQQQFFQLTNRQFNAHLLIVYPTRGIRP